VQKGLHRCGVTGGRNPIIRGPPKGIGGGGRAKKSKFSYFKSWGSSSNSLVGGKRTCISLLHG